MSEPRQTAVNHRLIVRNLLGVSFLLCIPIAFIAGTVTQEPLAVGAAAAGIFSLSVGILIVAPLAGSRAKRNFFNTLANPTPDDEQLILRGVYHIIEKMGFLAQDPECQSLFAPLWKAYSVGLDRQWDATVMNLKSQAVQGKGAFNLENLSDAEQKELIGQEFERMVVDRLHGFLDPTLDKLGFSENGKALAHAKVMNSFRNMKPNNGSGARGSPALTDGSNPYHY